MSSATEQPAGTSCAGTLNAEAGGAVERNARAVDELFTGIGDQLQKVEEHIAAFISGHPALYERTCAHYLGIDELGESLRNEIGTAHDKVRRLLIRDLVRGQAPNLEVSPDAVLLDFIQSGLPQSAVSLMDYVGQEVLDNAGKDAYDQTLHKARRLLPYVRRGDARVNLEDILSGPTLALRLHAERRMVRSDAFYLPRHEELAVLALSTLLAIVADGAAPDRAEPERKVKEFVSGHERFGTFMVNAGHIVSLRLCRNRRFYVTLDSERLARAVAGKLLG